MSNETIFFILGIALAVSAVVVSFIGLKVKGFPGKAMPIVALWFIALAGGAATFAVLHAKDEDKARGNEYSKANERLEKATSSGPYEEAAEKQAEEEAGGEEAGGGEAEEAGGAGAKEEAAEEAGTAEGEEPGAGGAGSAEAGKQVFISNSCGSCHTFAAAGTTGTVGPDLNESLATDDDKEGIEEMIVDPEAEIAEGYSGGIMPQNFGALLSEEELADLVEFLYVNSPAGEGK